MFVVKKAVSNWFILLLFKISGKPTFKCHTLSTTSIAINQCYFSKENRFRIASDPKFGQRRGGVSYMDAGKNRFQNAALACVLLRKNFWNSFAAHSVTENTPAINPLKQSGNYVYHVLYRSETLHFVCMALV